MSAAHLPPAEPPADDVADLVELLQRGRLCRADADATLGRLLAELAVEGMPAPAKMYFDVERIVAEHRLYLWGVTMAALEGHARAIGLQP